MICFILKLDFYSSKYQKQGNMWTINAIANAIFPRLKMTVLWKLKKRLSIGLYLQAIQELNTMNLSNWCMRYISQISTRYEAKALYLSTSVNSIFISCNKQHETAGLCCFFEHTNNQQENEEKEEPPCSIASHYYQKQEAVTNPPNIALPGLPKTQEYCRDCM